MPEIDDRTIDRHITRWYLAAVALAGLIYVGIGLTPSSYGGVLKQLGAPEAGPVWGIPRSIRGDEWALLTPSFQASVRNRFQRVNETSFYREDLRNFIALPLADWSLVFKPQLWAFFLLPPATAYSIYYAVLMCGFLAGYHLLFRQLETPAWLAAAAAVMLFFSGFTQFWWTTFGPPLAAMPWILIIVLRPIAWWKKAPLCALVFPVFVLAHLYPTLLIALAWGLLIAILAFRPSLLRAPGNLAAIAIGVVSAAAVVYAYFADVIPIMRNTVYPGHRISPSGGTPVLVVLSQIFPFLDFRIADYESLTAWNICEIGTVGSFLPLLTLCLTRYRLLWAEIATRTTLLILLSGFTAVTVYEMAPLPAWIGRIFLADTGPAHRWLFTSGFLLTLSCLLIWSRKLISFDARRVALFILIGPVASVGLKVALLIHKGESMEAASSGSRDDILFCGFAIMAGLAARYLAAEERAPVFLVAILFMNIFGFARFNPLQPAGPIFQTPDTAGMRKLRTEAAASPDGTLVDPRFFGATLNGLGFRSVSHALPAPQLAIFRRYFPLLDAERFNYVFNRCSYIELSQNAMPDVHNEVMLEVPTEPFVPVRNLRTLTVGPASREACAQPEGGGVGEISAGGSSLTVTGWAPWSSETGAQGIRVLSARRLHAESLSTVTRPDIAERLQDYRFVKAGFKLRISTDDGKPLREDEVAIVAFGTSQGEVRLDDLPLIKGDTRR